MFRFFSHSKRRDGYEKVEYQYDASVRVFKPRELIVATEKFSPGRVLGEGGRVYKGVLKDGQEVAVKRFEEQADLWAEVQMLNSVEHPNIVKMIGYCDKEKDHIIVYEFMPLRSLDLHLHDLKPGKTPLYWKTRMKIAMGVAKALEYLHDQKDPPIIYSGLKRSSILLDENYDPKLSDLGCAEHGPTLNHTAANRKFSLCYLGPEYPMTGSLSLKSDVYSFGVVLLELISGKKAINGYNNVVYGLTERDWILLLGVKADRDEAEFRYDLNNIRVFESRELIVATDNFNPRRVLGEGSLGRVYKGILKDGQEVAVKRFDRQENLCTEVKILSCLEHSNLVKMIGYCDKGKDHMIVYEFVPLRSLSLYLHGKVSLFSPFHGS
ncbi:serine/threonine-protein kinase PBS1-like [Papaver somniferum]|uniref:serine/threonine-protein kinase PBS1-like n=1 Tax=Papaver somniferum TaxID=3469 RepID=UPI000E6FACD0|nr:serine/threonine-protein kinase PBS1-like [Papaver somniferum]